MAHSREPKLIPLLTAMLVVGGNLTVVAINAATADRNRWPWGLELIRVHPFGWSLAFTVVVLMIGAAISRLHRTARRLEVLIPAVEKPEGWVVDRPGEVKRVVTALRRREGSTVGVTTALHGAGGFGKTTVAKMIRSDPRVLRRFGGHVYWVTMGRDVQTKGAIANKVNDVIKRVTLERSEEAVPLAFADPQPAGEHLGALLANRQRRLIVLDDVWYPEQLAPFAVGAEECSRLVTTRNRSLLAGDGVAIQVDQMSREQAQELLTWKLSALPNGLVDALLVETGRWPLLLRLVNKVLADQALTSAQLTSAAEDVRDRLRQYGALAIDDMTGEARRPLDVNDPVKRQQAVRATIEASTDLLSAEERTRLAELAVFAENEIVPMALVSRLWRATAGIDVMATGQVSARLSELALVSLSATDDGGTIGIHAVVRDYFLDQLGPDRERALHAVLLDVVAADLPEAPTPSQGSAMAATSWWQLDQHARYLWEHLVEHLVAAGREAGADALTSDIRWVAARLAHFGPAAPYTDLALLSTARANRLRTTLAQTAHLLGPTDPVCAQIDVLHSRVDHDLDWGPQIARMEDQLQRPRLVNLWPLPDLPDPGLRRTILTQHRGGVYTLAAPNSDWLASGGADGSVQIWDTNSGHQRATLKGHRGAVHTLTVAPDSSWLASGSGDGSIAIWDAGSWQQRAKLKGHRAGVYTLAAAPDSSWLASAGADGSVRIWDAETGELRARAYRREHRSEVYTLAVAPDGSWLASGRGDGSVQIWDSETGELRAFVHEQSRGTYASTMTVSPDGKWLISCDRAGSVWTWNADTGQKRDQPMRRGVEVRSATFDRDCTWLASGSLDGSVSLWKIATGQQTTRFSGHQGAVSAIVLAPDDAWLCSAGIDGVLRIWDFDPTDQQQITGLTGHANAVSAVVIGPDGRWLASGGADGSVRIWNIATGQEHTHLAGHPDAVHAIAVSPDGSWLCSGGANGSIHIWDTSTGQERKPLRPQQVGGVSALALAADGRWLASGGADGRIHIWDLVTGRQREWPGTDQGRAVLAIAVMPDGHSLASGGADGVVRIWDVDKEEELASLGRHVGEVLALALAPNGAWLASGGADGAVRIWDVATRRHRTFLAAESGAVHAVAVAPNGAWLAAVSLDQTLRIWDVATGSVCALMRIEERARSCAWTPDGRAIAVGGTAGLYLFAFRSRENQVLP